MTRRLDLSGLSYGRSPARTFAAVQNWVLDTVSAGGWPLTTWDGPIQALTDTTESRLAGVADVGAWLAQAPFTVDGVWTLRHARWLNVLQSITAAPATPGLQGAPAVRALGNSRTASSQVRITEFSFTQAGGGQVTGLIAAVVSAHGMHLFDPVAGLYSIDVADNDAHPVNWFVDHMEKTYGESADITCRTRMIVVSDVFFAWFGPPTAAVAKDGAWSDVKGPIAIARSSVAAGRQPRVKFCCLAQYQDAFERKFRRLAPNEARHIEVRAVDDQFVGGLGQQGLLAAPDYTDLDRCVRTILTRSVANFANKRALVNAKNVWSLYCMYEFGGYHLDTGVILADGIGTATFPDPDQFACLWYNDGPAAGGGNAGTVYQHITGAFGHSGVGCITIMPSTEGNSRALAMDLPVPVDVNFERLDVPILRSPRRSRGAELALRTYIEMWFRMQANQSDPNPQIRFSAAIEEAIYANMVLAAAATAVCHPNPPPAGQCGYVQPTVGRNLLRATDLGLKKTGEQSHRAAPVVLPGV